MNTNSHFRTKHILLSIILGQIILTSIFFVIIRRNDNHSNNYTNSHIILRCRSDFQLHFKEITKIASLLKRTSYEGPLTLTYTNGFSFGSIKKDNQFSDVLRSFHLMYPERNSFPFGRIRYTPNLIIISTYLNQDNYYAFLIYSYLSENELLNEFPSSKLMSDYNNNKHTNWFYKIDTNYYVYFSRERYMAINPTHSASEIKCILDKFYLLEDTLQYIKNVLFDAKIKDTIIIQNFNSWYYPGCVDVFNDNYELLPRGLYRNITHYLDSYFIDEFYYKIKYFPDKQIVFYPANNKEYSFLFLVHPAETIFRDYKDYVVLNNYDNNREIGNCNQLYKINNNWYIQINK